MLAKITVADYMTKRLVMLNPEMNVIDAIELLLEHSITCAPVLDAQGHFKGMFSEIDGMKLVLESVYDRGMSGKVGDYMTVDTMSVDAATSIVDLAEKLQPSFVRSFPVFKDNELVGMISRSDILKALVAVASKAQ